MSCFHRPLLYLFATALSLSVLPAEAAKRAWPQTEFSQFAVNEAKQRLLPELKTEGLKLGAPVFIRVYKNSSELEVWMKKGSRYQLFKTYGICGMSGNLGPKTFEGDLQAPEGFYYFSRDSLNPWSSYHLSMNMGYPNDYDKAHKRTGSALMVHGTCLSLGCFAMGDENIEEIYTLVDAALRQGERTGHKIVRIHSFPFRMTDDNMKNLEGAVWHPFWENLKIGHDWFEEQLVPPNTRVKNKKYVFSRGS